MLKLWDYVCPACSSEWEELVTGDEAARCGGCGAIGGRRPFAQGSAARALVDPVRIRETMSKAQHMKLRVQGRLPWRRSSHSQTDNT